MKYIICIFAPLLILGCANLSKHESQNKILNADGKIIAKYSDNKVHTYVYDKESDLLEKLVTVYLDRDQESIVTSHYSHENGKLDHAEFLKK